MSEIDDQTLVAYVDGELDLALQAEVETALARDPGLRERVRLLRETSSAVRVAFDHALHGAAPVPDPRATTRAGSVEARPSAKRFSLALAASLVSVLVGAGAAYLAATLQFERSERARLEAELRDAQALNGALESAPSGHTVRWTDPGSGTTSELTPVRTYRNATGQYCREYQHQNVHFGEQLGVACRSGDGQWKVRLRYYPG